MKKWGKLVTLITIGLLMITGVLAPAVAKAQDLPAQVQAIKDVGVLRVGIKEDVPNFGYLNADTREYEGFEIDLAKKIAEIITGSPDNIEFTGVTPKTRGPLLDNGEVDVVIATFTITDERRETYNFTEPYFVDEIGFLVRMTDGYSDLASLDGKNLGVPQSATTKELVEAEASAQGLSFNFSELGSYPEIKTALTSRRVDAMVVDKSILTGYVDDTVEILDFGFAPQEYGAATKKSNEELHHFLNDLLAEWAEDGTLDQLLADNNLLKED